MRRQRRARERLEELLVRGLFRDVGGNHRHSHRHVAKLDLVGEAFKDERYGLPDKKKFPLPDRSHVMSAIRFFNYVDPSDEDRLARAILKRMRELGIDEVNVGDGNRFKKHYMSARGGSA